MIGQEEPKGFNTLLLAAAGAGLLTKCGL